MDYDNTYNTLALAHCLLYVHSPSRRRSQTILLSSLAIHTRPRKKPFATLRTYSQAQSPSVGFAWLIPLHPLASLSLEICSFWHMNNYSLEGNKQKARKDGWSHTENVGFVVSMENPGNNKQQTVSLLAWVPRQKTGLRSKQDAPWRHWHGGVPSDSAALSHLQAATMQRAD